jgi:hypothetical protein
MKLTSVREAQANLPELVLQAREEAIGLTDDAGNLVGVLAGVDEDDVDELLVGTRAFQAMIERSRRSLEVEGPVRLSDLRDASRRDPEPGLGDER